MLSFSEKSGNSDRKILDTALGIALPNNPVPLTSVNKTFMRTITRRGVLWLGQTCNLHCHFCYFIDTIHSIKHPEHAFMSVEKAKNICKTLVEHYGNNSVDIQGGEPTLYRDIYELIEYCNHIGLSPSLITNALALDDRDACRRYKDAGIKDFLVSLHGLGDTYDELVGLKGANKRQLHGIYNIMLTGIPLRYNCVLSKPVVKQLPLIAEFAIKTGARVINFIAFNPFADQAAVGRRNLKNVPRYSDIRAHLTAALDMLEEADIEANVRYLPICMLEERHRKSAYNFQQLSYDTHEWDFASWAWTGLQPQRMREGALSDPVEPSSTRWPLYFKALLKRLANIACLRHLLYKAHWGITRFGAKKQSKEELYREIARVHAEVHCKYEYGRRCQSCAIKGICDGFHGDYAGIFGMEEAVSVQGDLLISDELFFIKKQSKVVD